MAGSLIGLAWFTNNQTTGRSRSIDLALLAPLFGGPDLKWISLQYGDTDALERETAGTGMVVDRSVDQFVSIDRFAAQIAAMDLVITIDNSTAHLAGSLGIPTWVLLPFCTGLALATRSRRQSLVPGHATAPTNERLATGNPWCARWGTARALIAKAPRA